MKNGSKRKAGVWNPKKTRTSGWSGARPRKRKKAAGARVRPGRPGLVARAERGLKRVFGRFAASASRRAPALWAASIGLWLVLLSGLLSDFTGSPGLLQAWRLRGLLEHRQGQLKGLETELAETREKRRRFRRSPAAQEAEIRRVLGYAGKDEIIFDFSSVSRQKVDTPGSPPL